MITTLNAQSVPGTQLRQSQLPLRCLTWTSGFITTDRSGLGSNNVWGYNVAHMSYSAGVNVQYTEKRLSLARIGTALGFCNWSPAEQVNVNILVRTTYLWIIWRLTTPVSALIPSGSIKAQMGISTIISSSLHSYLINLREFFGLTTTVSHYWL